MWGSQGPALLDRQWMAHTTTCFARCKMRYCDWCVESVTGKMYSCILEENHSSPHLYVDCDVHPNWVWVKWEHPISKGEK